MRHENKKKFLLSVHLLLPTLTLSLLIFSTPAANASAHRSNKVFNATLASYTNNVLPPDYLIALDQLGHFKVSDISKITIPAEGARRTTFEITLKTGAQFIMKREPQNEQAVRHTIRLSTFYRRYDVPYPQYLQPPYVIINSNLYTLQQRLPGKAIRWGEASNSLLTQLAVILAHIHEKGIQYQPVLNERSFRAGEDPRFIQIDLLEKICAELSEFYDALEIETKQREHTNWQGDPAKLERGKILLSKKNEIEKAIKFLQPIFGNHLGDTLPSHLRIHGDFVNSNLMIENDILTGIIDLERTRDNATRWEDLAVPIFHLPINEQHQTFDFDRFSLWLTTYSNALTIDGIKLTPKEKEPASLRGILIAGYLQELHKALANRESWSLRSGLEQIANIEVVFLIPQTRFDELTLYLNQNKIWDKPVPEPSDIKKTIHAENKIHLDSKPKSQQISSLLDLAA